MKRHFPALVVAAVCLFGCRAHLRGVIILCAGDSLTEKGYPPYLERILRREGYKARVLNRGRSGNTSGEYLNYLRENEDRMRAAKPDIVLVELGTNDVRVDGDRTSADDFFGNLESILDVFLDFRNREGGKALVFLATVPPVPEGTPLPFSPESSLRVASEINPAIGKLAERKEVVLVDQFSIFTNDPRLLADVHPSPEGYRAMAEAWFDGIRPYLPKKQGN